LFTEVERDYRINRRKSFRKIEERWNLHLKPFFGGMRAVDVGASMLKRYVDARLQEGASAATVNREMSQLKRAFTLGRDANKLRDVPKFPHLQEAPPRQGFLEEADYNRIVAACPELWFRAMVECSRNYGWRLGELSNLRCRQIDLAARTIRLDAGETKSGAGRVVIMTDGVYVLLSECVRGKWADDYVFTRVTGKPAGDFRVTWHNTCVAAGVGFWECRECQGQRLDAKSQCPACGRVWKAKQRRYVGKLFHDWRRTGVRNMVRDGIPERVAMTISGHKTRSIFDRYDIVSEADLREAAAKMNRRDEAARQKAEGYVSATFEEKRAAVTSVNKLN
jgi:integrase